MNDLETELRTHASYDTAHRAIETLRDVAVWPTPINYELSLHVVSDPTGPLARAVRQLIADGALHSDDFSDKLAKDFLPRLNLQNEICEAGDALAHELDRVGRGISAALTSNAQVSRAMTAADAGLSSVGTLADARAYLLAAKAAIHAADARGHELKGQLDASAAEVARLRRLMERGRREAMTDPLTHLPNRRAFDREIGRACADSDADTTPLILVMMDIDHFKRVNDTWGHQTGDQVIRFVGSILKAFGVPPRMPARYGGEEFALIMPRERLERAMRELDDMRLTVSRRMLRLKTTNEELGRVTLSFGVAQREPGEAASALIGRADAALYAAKRAGRNTIVKAPEGVGQVPVARSA